MFPKRGCRLRRSTQQKQGTQVPRSARRAPETSGQRVTKLGQENEMVHVLEESRDLFLCGLFALVAQSYARCKCEHYRKATQRVQLFLQQWHGEKNG